MAVIMSLHLPEKNPTARVSYRMHYNVLASRSGLLISIHLQPPATAHACRCLSMQLLVHTQPTTPSSRGDFFSVVSQIRTFCHMQDAAGQEGNCVAHGPSYWLLRQTLREPRAISPARSGHHDQQPITHPWKRPQIPLGIG